MTLTNEIVDWLRVELSEWDPKIAGPSEWYYCSPAVDCFKLKLKIRHNRYAVITINGKSTNIEILIGQGSDRGRTINYKRHNLYLGNPDLIKDINKLMNSAKNKKGSSRKK